MHANQSSHRRPRGRPHRSPHLRVARAVSVAVLLVGTGALAFVGEVAAAAQVYTFTNIVDTSGPFNNLTGGAVSANGAVAFWASRDLGGQGVYTAVRGTGAAGGAVTTIADSTGPLFEFNLGPAISRNGTVAFAATRDVTAGGGTGLYTGTGGALTMLIDTTGPLHGAAQPSINDAGVVAFQGILDAAIGQNQILTINPATAPSFTPISPLMSSTQEWPVINDAGVVAFTGQYGGSGAILRTDAAGVGPLAPAVDTSGPFFAFGTRHTMNSAGTIAFVAGRDADMGGFGGGVYTVSAAGVVTTIADDAGPFRSFSGGAAIDDAGDIAFWATLDTEQEGIFTGPDAIADKVIATDDTLFGQQVVSLGLPHLHPSTGEIVFRYGLSNGRAGYAVATVPEPASGAAAAALALAMGHALTSRRRRGR